MVQRSGTKSQVRFVAAKSSVALCVKSYPLPIRPSCPNAFREPYAAHLLAELRIAQVEQFGVVGELGGIKNSSQVFDS